MIGRNLTALNWTCCALAAGLIVGRITGRIATAIFSSLATFGLLWQMSSEPSHPGSLISAMLALAALASVASYQKNNWTCLGLITGITAGLLLLTKINVGIFFVAGAGLAALRFTDWRESWRKPAALIAATGLLLLPWGLMGKKLGEPWVLIFTIQFTGAAAGLLWVTPPRQLSRATSPRTWAIATIAFIATLLVVAFTVCLRGTSLASLVHAVFVEPLRHPASFMIGLHWPGYVWPFALVCWAITFRTGWDLRKNGTVNPIIQKIILAVRLIMALAFILHAEPWLTIAGIKGFMIFCLPLLPVFLVPLIPRDDWPEKSVEANVWLACLALPQVLHAYPVMGSQMGWGAFLLVPVMVTGLYDATQSLRYSLPGLGRRLFRFSWSLLLLTGAVQLGLLVHTGWTRYHESEPLGLPGAEDIRAGDRASQMLRILTLNASLHADVLFSRPGMYSYNIWSHVPTPTDKNATHWFWLLNQADQQKIVDQLQHVPRSAIITSTGLDDFLATINVGMSGVLHDYIRNNYRSLFSLEDLHFLVPTASQAVPFGQWELLVPASNSQENQFPFLLRTNVAIEGRPVSIRLRNISSPWTILEEFSPNEAEVVLEPINTRGAVSGPSLKLPLLHSIKGLFRLNIYTKQKPHLEYPRNVVLQIMDDRGAILSESIN